MKRIERILEGILDIEDTDDNDIAMSGVESQFKRLMACSTDGAATETAYKELLKVVKAAGPDINGKLDVLRTMKKRGSGYMVFRIIVPGNIINRPHIIVSIFPAGRPCPTGWELTISPDGIWKTPKHKLPNVQTLHPRDAETILLFPDSWFETFNDIITGKL